MLVALVEVVPGSDVENDRRQGLATQDTEGRRQLFTISSCATQEVPRLRLRDKQKTNSHEKAQNSHI